MEVQDFIQLAKNVRPCDKALPPVVIADHMYGHDKVADQHVLSGYYAALAAWHDVMAFNHANAVRHELIGNFENGTAVMQLMGSDYNLHMGAGFHIGMAWTALFNFLESFVDNCNDISAAEVPMEDSATASGRIDYVLKSPPVKQLSKLSKEGKSVISGVVDLWKQRDEEAKSRCAAIIESDTNSLLCSYAWVVGKGTGINRID